MKKTSAQYYDENTFRKSTIYDARYPIRTLLKGFALAVGFCFLCTASISLAFNEPISQILLVRRPFLALSALFLLSCIYWLLDRHWAKQDSVSEHIFYCYRPESPFNSFLTSVFCMFGMIVLADVIVLLMHSQPLTELTLVRRPSWILALTLLAGSYAWLRERYIHYANEEARFGAQK
jgi:hypothetical protein